MGHGLRVAVAGLLLAAGACSPSPDPAPPALTATRPSETSPTTTANEAVSASTIQACRDLADDHGLAGYWSKVADGQVDAPSAVDAANAIRGLEVYLPMQDVDPTVLASIKSATDAVAADGTLPGRPDDFRDVVTPIVTACMDLGIDMAVK